MELLFCFPMAFFMFYINMLNYILEKKNFKNYLYWIDLLCTIKLVTENSSG